MLKRVRVRLSHQEMQFLFFVLDRTFEGQSSTTLLRRAWSRELTQKASACLPEGWRGRRWPMKLTGPPVILKKRAWH